PAQGTGTLNVNAGATVSVSGASSGTLRVWQNGTVNVTGGTLNAGNFLVVNAGGHVVLNSGIVNAGFQVPIQGAGASFTQNGGALVATASGAVLFMQQGGHYTINDGTINVYSIDVGGLTLPNGAGTMDINGGAVAAS